MEHRTKLINIFPYILGAVTPEILAKRQELSDLEKKLKRKERELEKMQEVSDRWYIEIGGWINAAKEYGLIEAEHLVDSLSFRDQLALLKEISQKNNTDVYILGENIKNSSKQIVELRKRENEISLELSKYKSPEIPVAFEREYSLVQGKISELTENLNSIA